MPLSQSIQAPCTTTPAIPPMPLPALCALRFTSVTCPCGLISDVPWSLSPGGGTISLHTDFSDPSHWPLHSVSCCDLTPSFPPETLRCPPTPARAHLSHHAVLCFSCCALAFFRASLCLTPAGCLLPSGWSSLLSLPLWPHTCSSSWHLPSFMGSSFSQGAGV